MKTMNATLVCLLEAALNRTQDNQALVYEIEDTITKIKATGTKYTTPEMLQQVQDLLKYESEETLDD